MILGLEDFWEHNDDMNSTLTRSEPSLYPQKVTDQINNDRKVNGRLLLDRFILTSKPSPFAYFRENRIVIAVSSPPSFPRNPHEAGQYNSASLWIAIPSSSPQNSLEASSRSAPTLLMPQVNFWDGRLERELSSRSSETLHTGSPAISSLPPRYGLETDFLDDI